MSQPQDPAFSLTTHLLSLDSHAFTLATQSPFLHHAGLGTLPKSTLQTWLAQDRLYAQAYIQFFSHLLSNIRLPAAVEKESRDERLVDILIESLVNVRRELKFFEDVAGRYGLELEVGEEGVGKGVLGYRALFEDVRKSVEESRGEEKELESQILKAIVLLYATELCYLRAWQSAKSAPSSSSSCTLSSPTNPCPGPSLWTPKPEDLDGGALRKEFIPNWTSVEFEGFVNRIEVLLDDLWGRAERGVQGLGMCEDVWRRVLEVERVFWPVVDKEGETLL